MTLLGEKLKELGFRPSKTFNIGRRLKSEDINTYYWEGPIDSGTGVRKKIRLMDATKEQLHEWYHHCMSMLHSNQQPFGRMHVLKLAETALQACRAEAFKRTMHKPNPIEFYASLTELLSKPEYVAAIPPSEHGIIPIGQAIHIEDKYADLPIALIKSACVCALGSLPKGLVSKSLITSFGIYPTSEEIAEYFPSQTKDIIEQIHIALRIPENIPLKLFKGGLTYSEFRSVYKMKTDAYASMTTTQLKTLSEKVLPKLISKVKAQIDNWETIRLRILQVCDTRKIERPEN